MGGCHKAVEFLSNTGPDPLNNHKATKLAFNAGPSSAFHWLPFMGLWWPTFSVIGIL